MIDEQQCYETVRTLRWSDGVVCPHCRASSE
ncbi:MAG: transposase [Francisellaceae bacterium]